MHRYRHLAVALSRSDADAGLIRYAALVARLGTAREVRFVHVLPGPGAGVPEHDRAVEQMRACVKAHFTGVPDTAEVFHDVLSGPLTDGLLAYVAEKQV